MQGEGPMRSPGRRKAAAERIDDPPLRIDGTDLGLPPQLLKAAELLRAAALPTHPVFRVAAARSPELTTIEFRA